MVAGSMHLGRTSWWSEFAAEEVFYLMAARKQSKGKALGLGLSIKAALPPSDLLPPGRPTS
jgi:hypothetical protein